MYHLIVFVPSEFKEKVKAAMFAAGAGKWGAYDQCCFELQGMGQFRPLEGSQPFIGKSLELEQVRETRLEIICEEAHYHQVILAMRAAHPYETPAYYAIKSVN
jgi:hypothetical protein